MKNLVKIKLLSLALILCACEEQQLSTDNNLSSIENGRTLSGTIVNIDRGTIDSVAIICDLNDWAVGSYVLSRSAVSSSGKFTLSLPIPSGLEKIGKIFSSGFSGTISDELAFVFQKVGSEIAAFKNGVEVGSIVKCNFLHSDNRNNLNAAKSGFIYSDRKTSVKGTDTKYGVTYDFTLQKGWNELVMKKTANPDYNQSVSNTVTSDLQWRYFAH